MGILREEDAGELREVFGGLANAVTIHLCSDDGELRELMDEVAACGGDKIVLHKLDLAGDAERAAALGLDRMPAMALTSAEAKGKILFWGLPLGYEMATLVATIVDLGGGEGRAELSEASRQKLAALGEDVHIQVFSTPG